MYLLHKDNTGSFQELVRSTDVIFGQLSILVVNAKCQRGGHYHTRKREWFCCLHGRCTIGIKDVKNQSSRVMCLDEAKREFVLINPYESHVVANFGDSKVCELLVIASEPYNPQDADTFKENE